MATKQHWTQTPEGKDRLSKAMKLAHRIRRKKAKLSRKETKIINELKFKSSVVKDTSDTVLVINGWKIRLGKGVIAIDNE